MFVVSVVASPSLLARQAENQPPREFPEYRGTWALDENASAAAVGRVSVPRRISIATSPTEILIRKDGSEPEVYRFDGSETRARDRRTGAELDRRFRFTLVAEGLALTSMLSRSDRGRTFTNTVTDLYKLADEMLTIERQLSVLVQPPGNLATFQQPSGQRATMIYRRVPDAAAH